MNVWLGFFDRLLNLALVIALLLLGFVFVWPAFAHGPGRPDLWTQADIWSGAKPSRDPCAGATFGTQDCSLETRVKAVLGISKLCDVPELLAASREWATLTRKSAQSMTLAILGPTLGSAEWYRAEANAIEYRERVEQRWRRAVESCK